MQFPFYSVTFFENVYVLLRPERDLLPWQWHQLQGYSKYHCNRRSLPKLGVWHHTTWGFIVRWKSCRETWPRTSLILQVIHYGIILWFIHPGILQGAATTGCVMLGLVHNKRDDWHSPLIQWICKGARRQTPTGQIFIASCKDRLSILQSWNTLVEL